MYVYNANIIKEWRSSVPNYPSDVLIFSIRARDCEDVNPFWQPSDVDRSVAVAFFLVICELSGHIRQLYPYLSDGCHVPGSISHHAASGCGKCGADEIRVVADR